MSSDPTTYEITLQVNPMTDEVKEELAAVMSEIFSIPIDPQLKPVEETTTEYAYTINNLEMEDKVADKLTLPVNIFVFGASMGKYHELFHRLSDLAVQFDSNAYVSVTEFMPIPDEQSTIRYVSNGHTKKQITCLDDGTPVISIQHALQLRDKGELDAYLDKLNATVRF